MSLSPSRVDKNGRTVPPHFIASNEQFEAPAEPQAESSSGGGLAHAPSLMLTPPVPTFSSSGNHRYANAEEDSDDEDDTGKNIAPKEDVPSPASSDPILTSSSKFTTNGDALASSAVQVASQLSTSNRSQLLLLSPKSVEIAPSGEDVTTTTTEAQQQEKRQDHDQLRTSTQGQQALLEFDILGGSSSNGKSASASTNHQGVRRASFQSAQTDDENPLELIKKTSEVRGLDGKVKKMTFARGSPSPSGGGSDAGSDTGSSLFSSTLGSSAATRSMVREKYRFDNGREYSCHRGRMVYSAAMDRSELQSCYSWNCVCGTEKKIHASKRTFIEVHTNGIYSNAPTGCCCLSMHDNTTFLHFDDERLGSVGRTKACCSPCPYMFANCFDCCGESLYVSQSPNSLCGRPSNFGHCGWSCLGFLFPTSFFYGLQEGEARVLAKEITQAKEAFKQRPPTLNHTKDLDYYNGGGYSRAGMTSQHLGTGLSRMGFSSSTRGMMLNTPAGGRSPAGSTIGTQSTGTHSEGVDSQLHLKPPRPYPVLQYYN